MLKKGINCHKNLSAVMANSGFGPLRITRGDYTLMLPASALKKDGQPKMAWQTRLEDWSDSNYGWMKSRGALIVVA